LIILKHNLFGLQFREIQQNSETSEFCESSIVTFEIHQNFDNIEIGIPQKIFLSTKTISEYGFLSCIDIVIIKILYSFGIPILLSSKCHVISKTAVQTSYVLRLSMCYYDDVFIVQELWAFALLQELKYPIERTSFLGIPILLLSKYRVFAKFQLSIITILEFREISQFR